MTRQEKLEIIEELSDKIKNASHFYLTDISDLDASETTNLRSLCFKKQVELRVVKNSLLEKALLKVDSSFEELKSSLKGHTSVMFCETGNTPAKLIKEFRKKSDKPILKAAYVEQSVYIGDEQLDILSNLKSKEELIADIIVLLQSPMKNVMSSLQSGSNIITGVLKTLSEKGE